MDMLHRYSGGGDKDGVPAEKKRPGKHTAPVARSSSSSSSYHDSFEHTTLGDGNDNHEVGLSSVKQRKPTEAQLLAGDTYTDMERIESSLQRLATSQQQASTSAAVSSAAISDLMNHVQGNEEPWRNRTRSEVDERLTTSLLDTARSNVTPTCFKHKPRLYNLDWFNMSDQEIIDYNNGDWAGVMFPDEHPSTHPSAEKRSYHSPFPGQSQFETDLHVHSRAYKTHLTFSLDSEDMTHTEFVQRYRNKNEKDADGTVKLIITRDMLLHHIHEQLKLDGVDIDWKNSPYHLNIYDINCTLEDSNMLVTFDKALLSAGGDDPDRLALWSTAHGVSNVAQNMIMKDRKFVTYNPIHAGQNRGPPLDPKPLYIAPHTVNGAECPRWINRNWKKIAEDLKSIVRGNAYQLGLPPRGKAKDFSFLQWFVMDEFEEIHRRTMAIGERPSLPKGPQVEFNKIYSSDSSNTSAVVLISVRVLDAMLLEKQTRWNQEELLMNTNTMMLVLWPLQGVKGWDTYERLAREQRKYMPTRGERVQYKAVISISFEPFRQALSSPAARSDFGGVSAEFHHGIADGAHDHKSPGVHPSIKSSYAALLE